jgi:DUF177 domain-containing protein
VVSVNVAQLLQEAPGAVREFDFSDRVGAVSDEMQLRGPVRGHTRLMRTSEGILVHSDHVAPVTLECARCLEDVRLELMGSFDEEFLPSVDLRTGLPVAVPTGDEQPRIDEHHEIDLDELLRQNILTNLPLQPLCEAACPGLCATCGQRLDRTHRGHAEDEAPIDPGSPFARLATLLKNEEDK